MSKLSEFLRLESLINTVGKPTVNALFPLDYEFYMLTLELVDSEGDLIDNLIFPVMPQSITEDERPNTSIKKTAGGITVLEDITFIPKTIQINGDFGRAFKFLLGREAISFKALRFSRKTGVYKREDMPGSPGVKTRVPIFNSKIKTGYGCIKVLESILEKSRGLDSKGNPMQLYLYNPALGNNYLVKYTSRSLSQNNPDSNMIWRYGFSLTAIAPLGSVREQATRGLVVSMAVGQINKGITNVVNKARASLIRTA